MIMRLYLYLMEEEHFFLFSLIRPINDTVDALKVLPEPEAKYNVPPSHDTILYIADTLLLTNA